MDAKGETCKASSDEECWVDVAKYVNKKEEMDVWVKGLFNKTANNEIYTLFLHDSLTMCGMRKDYYGVTYTVFFWLPSE